MSIIRGPHILYWGGNRIEGVEELDLEHEVDEEDYPTLDGKTRTLDGPYKVTATITLLETDIAALAVLMPQYFVPNGGILSTGETVNNAAGAIDIKAASCNQGTINNNLDIESCGNPADVLRIVNARSRIDDVDYDNKVRKVMIKFIGEADASEATIQFFKKNTIATVS